MESRTGPISSDPQLFILEGPDTFPSLDEYNESACHAILEAANNYGEGIWIQVWYPGTTVENYDVVRVKDGEIETAPLTVDIEELESK